MNTASFTPNLHQPYWCILGEHIHCFYWRGTFQDRYNLERGNCFQKLKDAIVKRRADRAVLKALQGDA